MKLQFSRQRYLYFSLVLATSLTSSVSAQSFVEVQTDLIKAVAPHLKCNDIVAANHNFADRSWTSKTHSEFDAHQKGSNNLESSQEHHSIRKGSGNGKLFGIKVGGNYEKETKNSTGFKHEQTSENSVSTQSSSEKTQQAILEQTTHAAVGLDCSNAAQAWQEIVPSTSAAVVQQTKIIEDNKTARLSIASQETLGLEQIKAYKKVSLENIQMQKDLHTFQPLINNLYGGNMPNLRFQQPSTTPQQYLIAPQQQQQQYLLQQQQNQQFIQYR